MVNEDISDFEAILQYFKDVDVVFHNAASKCTVCRNDPWKDLDVNAKGSLNVFEASRHYGVKKVIHASTGSVFGGKPKSFYGVSKLAGESYLRAFKEYYPDFNFTAIRYHHVFGSRQESGPNGGVVPIFIRKLLNGEPLIVYGDGYQQRHFTYVKDVVDWNFKCESEFDGEFINLAERDPMDLRQLIQILKEITGIETKIEYRPVREGDIKRFDVSDSVIKKHDFYWSRFRENLKETIKYAS
jgi:UDP-glucose 4-epimerase